MKRRAIVFDLDGTLLNTLDDLADSGNCVLSRYGFPTHPIDEYKYIVGEGIHVLIRRILPEDRRDQDTIAEVTKAYREEYGRRWDAKTKPYRGIKQLLDTLTADGITMGILSNKPHELVLKCVAKLLGDWTFDVVLGQREDVARKPDPAGALEIAEQWGLSPSQIAYVGDTGTDMETAVAAGMYPVGVLWGYRAREELLSGGAEVLLERPAELLEVLAAG